MTNKLVRFECRARWRVLNHDDRIDGWRGWLALQLRMLATRIDGLHWFAVLSDSTPRMTAQVADQCLVAGLEHGGRLWLHMASESAYDEVTRQAYPELYALDESAARN